ncbi:MAG: co-chaperone GroES [Planctomycetes bacterium]|nr:co-chaperone GroES [Planctomycetota bacterium]
MSKKAEKSDCGCGCGGKLSPLDDRVVVKRLEAEEKTAGGIILPDNAKEKPQKGEVIAVGPGKLLDSGVRAAPDVAAGDKVLFGKYSGTEVKVDGVELLIMRENDILAKL